MIGTTLSHYRILGKLGEGGMGVVYRAEDTKLGREVAIKVLPEAVARDPERLDRFQREAKILAALDHPNIVHLYSIEEDEGVRLLTMQLIKGKRLSDSISLGGMPLDRFFDIAIPLAEALAAAHGKGVTHRDLKPGNIMLTDDGRVKVLDFGLAKLHQTGIDGLDTQLGTEVLTQEGQILGTVAYMSPEQAQGKPLDERSDIFSLGIVLYEMVTGSRPFLGDNQISILSSIIRDIPATVTHMRPELPQHLGRILRHTLEKEPEQRFQAALDLRNELQSLQREVESGEALETANTEMVEPARSWQKRLLIAAATLFALILTAAGLNVGGVRDRLLNEEEREAPLSVETPTIAVLPFENLSPEPENEYFSRGMTEELVSKLSRIQRFRVRSTPLEWVRDDQQRIEDIGRELGVRYLLEGSVRKAGDEVRITALLIDTSSAFHLWSKDFDGELKDVFAVQEETALRIAEALDVELTAGEDETVRDRYTENPDAYDAYLRGWALIESFHISADGAEQRLEAAERHFSRALEIDDEYPLALAGLAMVESYTYYLGVDRTEARVQRAEELAERALDLAPGLPEALVALGQVGWLRGNYIESADRLRQALRRDPDNGYVWCELAAACNHQDPPDAQQAEEAARKAIRFQPGYTWAHTQLGWALESQERYHEAIAAFGHSVELNTEFRPGYLGLGDSYLAVGDYTEALVNYEMARQLRESADLLIDIGAVHSSLGDKEGSLRMLEMAFVDGYEDFAAVEANPRFASLRDDPRFQDLMQKYRQGGR